MKKYIYTFILLTFAVVFAACNSGTENPAAGGKIVKTHTADNLKFTILTDDGKLSNGRENFTLTITDADGKPVKMDAVSLNFNMPAMGSMAEMNDPATLTSTGTPGVFKGTVDFEMAGEWIAQIAYEGERKGKTTMAVTAY